MLNGPNQPQALHAGVQRLADDRAEEAVEVKRREVSRWLAVADVAHDLGIGTHLRAGVEVRLAEHTQRQMIGFKSDHQSSSQFDSTPNVCFQLRTGNVSGMPPRSGAAFRSAEHF